MNRNAPNLKRLCSLNVRITSVNFTNIVQGFRPCGAKNFVKSVMFVILGPGILKYSPIKVKCGVAEGTFFPSHRAKHHDNP